jgi:hypothetical protein
MNAMPMVMLQPPGFLEATRRCFTRRRLYKAQAFYADKSLRCLNERRRAPRKRAGFS